MINEAKNVREEDKLDKIRLIDYLSKNLEGFDRGDDLSIKQYAGGASNLTYLLQWDNKSAILRTAPKGVMIKSAHDMRREHKVLTLLNPHFNFAPKTILLCEDETVIGRCFYLMEKIDGIILRKNFSTSYSKKQTDKLCKNLIDVHVALHRVNIEATGLIELGHPQGYIKRQVLGWTNRYKNVTLEDSLTAKDLMLWLIENQPQDEKSCLIHNDYKLDNVVLSIQNPTKIISVLDWEMATIGSPLMDLGCSLAYWIQANDSPQMQAIRMMPTNQKGMWTREQLINYYAKQSDLETNSFDYYYVFGLFRLAVIVQQIYKRYAQGKTNNPKFKAFGDVSKVLILQAEKHVKKI